VITKHARGLSQDRIQRAVEEMQSMKTYPREEAEHRFLLKRAERVYRELPLYERDILAHLIDGFEEAMDMQDAEAIERNRLELAAMLDRFEAGFRSDSLDDEDDSDDSDF